MKFVAAALTVGTLTGAAVGQTVVLRFEGFVNTIYNAPIVREGYRLGIRPGFEQHFHEIMPCCGLPTNGTGMFLVDRNTESFIVHDLGNTFTLDSIDVASSLNNLPAVGLDIRGFLAGAATGTVNIPALGTGFTTVDGSPLGVVDELHFDGLGGGGGFVLDNVTLSEAAACYADCDTSTGVGVLDVFDFLCFQNRYDAGASYACDCDTSTGVGVCDVFDFLCFQNAYDAGCP